MIHSAIFLQAGGQYNIAIILVMFVVIYFMMIRPQMKKQKQERSFQSELTKGKKIITTSGIHGKIAEINENDGTVVVETGAGKLKMEKSAISMELSKKFDTTSEKK
ncbi:preprotein translocase subunit YajC [Aureivirga sp. CE67]|uniref:preprotein translocase subunit YajC n=1 Tax=Aureivirga sp. CE67 TaxID=1788983 RepID=UPI0018C995CF|nr:preprotein translocase subunit YajC [Aureivirga sp. CE67]